MQNQLVAMLLTAGLLTSCATTPVAPYWQNTEWVNALASTVQKDVQYLPNIDSPG